jgi:hypothetical protein
MRLERYYLQRLLCVHCGHLLLRNSSPCGRRSRISGYRGTSASGSGEN